MSEPVDLLEKYKKILVSNGIHDKVANVTEQDSGAKGDGMASVTKCVTVTFENQNKAPLNLFVKLHTDNPSHEFLLESLKAFEKEARFFTEYLPAANKYCESKGLKDLIDFYPKCYHGNERTIVLENLIVDKGYQMMPQDQRHDFNTASLALKTLAKHHAVSYAMIQENGGEEKFFERFANLDHDGMMIPMILGLMNQSFENALATIIAVVEKSKLDGANEILSKLNSFKGTGGDIVVDALGRDENIDKTLVLSHGDYKNNNMMVLKDKETNKIVHHIAIDLQLTRYSSAAEDVCFYLCSSVNPTVRQSRLEELLNTYRETLNKISKDLGHPTNLSYEGLLMQYRRKFKFGFQVAASLVGPGMALFKMANIDISKIEVADFFKVFHECLLKWIDDNPDKEAEMAEEIKNLVEEYNKLEI